MNNIKKIILPCLMIIIAIILCIPSVAYLIENKTVDGFNSYYTYSLKGYRENFCGMLEGATIIGLLMLFGILYIIIVKESCFIFKNMKHALIFVILISLLFTIILPFLSSDIYYYIGDSWIYSKYKENPYYTSVKDLQNNGINDEILRNTGYWCNTTSIYGPMWNSIAKILVGCSNGHITIALYIFKFTSLLIHILNCYLIYKLTNRSIKYFILYGLNPLVLIELLSNVHNDIYLIMFELLALYFLLEKRSKILTLIFLAFSISIKYSTALLVPFVLIYMYKDEKITKRILYCLISGISIIAMVVLFYLPYYKDTTIFSNMLIQGTKYSQSIMLFLNETDKSGLIFNFLNRWNIPIFLVITICILAVELLNKKINLNKIFSKYNLLMLIFIFIILTNFQKWYILWLMPTIIWQNKNMKIFIIYLSITAIVPSFNYFIIGTDLWQAGISYSIKILILSSTILVLDMLINKYFQQNKEKDNML